MSHFLNAPSALNLVRLNFIFEFCHHDAVHYFFEMIIFNNFSLVETQSKTKQVHFLSSTLQLK